MVSRGREGDGEADVMVRAGGRGEMRSCQVMMLSEVRL